MESYAKCHDEATKLCAAHVPKMASPGVDMASMQAEASGLLALLLQLLSASGLNFGKIIAFAATIVPLFLARPINWTAIAAAVFEFFKNNPTPTPAPVNPNVSVS